MPQVRIVLGREFGHSWAADSWPPAWRESGLAKNLTPLELLSLLC